VTETNDRLVRAVTAAADVLEPYGFRIIAAESGGRGSSVDLTNGFVLISVGIDWLEGAIDVTVNSAGYARPIADVVDLSKAHGRHLQNLSKGVSADSLASQMRQVFSLLCTDAPDVLAAS
jgi:hypothetical protein